MLLDVSPNMLERLGPRNLRDAEKVLHFRRNPAGLHDSSRLPLAGGCSRWLRCRSRGYSSHQAQVRVMRRRRKVPERWHGQRRLRKRRRFAWEKGSHNPQRHRHFPSRKLSVLFPGYPLNGICWWLVWYIFLFRNYANTLIH